MRARARRSEQAAALEREDDLDPNREPDGDPARVWGGFALGLMFAVIGAALGLAGGWDRMAVGLVAGGGVIVVIQLLWLRRGRRRRRGGRPDEPA
ncbi:hypothetical protein [Microbacterium arborescens]|uniref:hypothetical protein n=1 Tax=Microbacterium arborescens TaxID=33883 RepID=UPI003C74A41D